MSRLRGFGARFVAAMRGRGADDDLREEMQAHLEMQAAAYVAQGMTPDDARRQALIDAGGVTAAVEAVGDQRGIPALEQLGADLRYVTRSLRRAPAFAGVVVITLALGIGATTAIFSVVHGVLLKPLPHADGDRLVYLRHSMEGPGGESIAFSVPEVADLRAGAPSLAGGVAEFSSWDLTHAGPEDAIRVDVGLVTGNYFEVMGLSPVLGRLTNAGDDGAGAAPVMVLTYPFWQRRFGGDSAIIGRTVRMDGQAVTVVGIVEPAPFFPGSVDALLNMSISEHHTSATMVQGRTHRMTEMVARLAPGATLAQARVEVAAVADRIRRDYSESYDPGSNHRIAVVPFAEVLGERARLTLLLLMGAAAFVLVISAANVANLTLMRGVRRQHELVVRAALGAGVARLRRLVLVENLMLTLAGAALGVGIAAGGVRLLTALAERVSPRAAEIAIDIVVLAFTTAVAITIALALSYLATLPREGGIAGSLLGGAHRIAGSRSRFRLHRALVVVQVAVSVMLLAGAGLLTRTLVQLANVSTGLRTEEVLSIQVPLATPTELMTDPTTSSRARATYERIRQEVASLPGVTAVAIGTPMPLRSSDVRFDVRAEGFAPAPGEPVPRAEFRLADPDFFRAAGIPLVAGRPFTTGDRTGGGLVAIINQHLADRLFPGENAIGRRIAWTGEILRFTPISDAWRTVVGVVATTRDGGLAAEPRAALYMPFAQGLPMSGVVVIRADSNVAALATAATRIVSRIAPTAPIERVMTVAQQRDQSVAPRRLNAMLMSSFGIVAVLIAAVGIAGVLAFSVSARTAEIGIRMSMGADRGRVQRMILGEGGRLLLLGLALGVAGSLLGGRLIDGLLFGVTARDPITLGLVAMGMGLVGLVACWIPARRASRVDPVIAMRAA